MATFNPPIQGNQVGTPSYVDASRGVDPGRADSSWGTLFEGIGQIAVNIGKTVDFRNQQNINQDIGNEVEEARNLFGVGDATDIAVARGDPLNPEFSSRPMGRTSGIEITNVPEALTGGMSRLDRLQEGYRQGTISESHYYGLLNGVVREMKSRYPGYEDYIDDRIQAVTGVTPANALRSALQREAEAEASDLSASERTWQNWENTNQEFIEMAYPGYFANRENYSSISRGRIQSTVAGIQAEQVAIEHRTKEDAEAARNDTLTSERALRSARSTAATVGNQLLQGAMNAAGGSESVGERLAALQETAAAGGVLDPQETQQVLQTLNQVRTRIQAQASEFLTQPLDSASPDLGSYASIMTGTQRQEVTALFTEPIDNMINAITNGDYGLARANAAVTTAIQDTEVRRLMEGNRYAARLGAVRTTFGDTMVNILMTQKGIMGDVNSALSDYVVTGVLSGEQSITQIFQDLNDQLGEDVDPSLYLESLNRATSAIIDPNLSPEMRTAFVTNLFSRANRDFIDHIPDDEKTRIFGLLVNPESTRAIQELSNSNPDVWNSYSTWAHDTFVKLFRQHGADVQSAIQYRKNINIVWNVETSQFDYTYNHRGQQDAGLRAWMESAANNTAISKIVELNSILRSYSSVLEGNNIPIEQGMLAALGQLGINPDAPRLASPQDFIRNAIRAGEGLGPLHEVGPEGDPPPSILDSPRPAIPGEGLGEIVEPLRSFRGEDIAPNQIDRRRLLGGEAPEAVRERERLRPQLNNELTVIPADELEDFLGRPDRTFDGEPGLQRIPRGPGLTEGQVNVQLASLSEDAASLLNFVGDAEAPRGYDTVFGNQQGQLEKPLTQMTVGEVLASQGDWSRRFGSSAAGRYQFIQSTLSRLVRSNGIDRDALFDGAMQDRLAEILLNERGLQDFQSGNLSASQFANNLAMEWAALPTSSGRSYYQGVGNNRALVSRGQVLDVLSNTSGRRFQGDPASVGYANIPSNEINDFMQWNPDPIGNHEANLRSVNRSLQGVVRRAQEISGVKFVVGSGERDADQQALAIRLGWSHTNESNHLHGDAVDLWVIDENGQVTFDREHYEEAQRAMQQAAEELGVEVVWGGNWRNPDVPHFELKETRQARR